MRILAVGDIVGESGVRKLKEELPRIKREENIDFVITNGENSAGGMGINERNFNDMLSAGTNVVTMGNHTWGKKDIFKFIDHPQLLRPANYPKGVVGKGLGIYECNGKKIAVMNFMGRVDINILTENPFIMAKDMVEEIKEQVDIIIIDFHAEATAEKIAMARYLDGKITAINFVQKKSAEHKSKLKSDPVIKLPTADHFVLSEDKEEKLSQIIAEINSIAGKDYDNDVAVKAMLQIKDIMMKSEKLKRSAKNNTEKDFEFAYFDNIDDALIEGLEQNQDFFSLLLGNDEMKKKVLGIFSDEIYNSLKNAD